MSEQTKGLKVEVLFELNLMNVREFLTKELMYLDLEKSDARCGFQKRLIQKCSCMAKQYLDILQNPDTLLTEKDLEDTVSTIHEINEKIEAFKRIELLN